MGEEEGYQTDPEHTDGERQAVVEDTSVVDLAEAASGSTAVGVD